MNISELESLHLKTEKAYEDYMQSLEKGMPRQNIDMLRSAFKTANDAYTAAMNKTS